MARVRALLAAQRTVSFEFFPPKSIEGAVQLTTTLNHLESADPSFISITYGAGGSDRQRTVDTVVGIQTERRLPTVAHLTGIGHSKAEVADLCDRYAAAGVVDLLALRGDPPAEAVAQMADGDFRHASDLVEFLRADGRFGVGVAAHPEGHPHSPDIASDRRHLARKLSAADFGVTQFFFEIDHYLSMVNDLADLGCDTPVIPGIIPITDAKQVKRFAQLAGSTLPSWLTDRIDAARSPEEVERIGIDCATVLARQLLDAGAPGVHLYTLNRSGPSLAVASACRDGVSAN